MPIREARESGSHEGEERVGRPRVKAKRLTGLASGSQANESGRQGRETGESEVNGLGFN